MPPFSAPADTTCTGLTGSLPALPTSTIAGSAHALPLKTRYYTASIPIWLDEVTTPATWATEFLAPEAKEVLSVLGAFLVAFRKPVDEKELGEVKELLARVGEVAREGCGYGWDGVCVAVGMPQSTTPYLEMSAEEWDDVCQDSGFEYVDFEGKGKNEFSGKQINPAWGGLLTILCMGNEPATEGPVLGGV
jgi:hypothetical protein